MTEAPPAVRLILASASPHRRKLLQAAGLIFDVEPAPIDEAAIKGALLARGGDANSIAGGLAAAKARAVSSRHRDAMVIGADQVLDCEGRLFDKPGSLANAARTSCIAALRLHTTTASFGSARIRRPW
jgi:septum formation protein